jgi:CTP:molybdopterin cytidylyltransferase MocA
VVHWAVRAALDAAIGPVWVVTGAVDLADALPSGVRVLPNPAWEAGQATSLQVAVAAAREADLDAIVVGLGDQPGIGPDPWRAVAASGGSVAVATYGGRRRNPVRLGRDIWPRLPATGDRGARVIMREEPGLVCEVACSGNPADIDTVEDLNRWS